MYCTIDDLKNRIGEYDLIRLVDHDETGELDETNQARVQAVIDTVTTTIDMYAKKQVSIPLTDERDLSAAKEIAIAKSIYHLHLNSESETDENIITAYNAAMRKLREISWIGTSTPPESTVGFSTTTRTKQFDADELDKM